MAATHRVVLSLTLLSTIFLERWVAMATTCYKCDRVRNPAECKDTDLCSSNQVCGTVVMAEVDGTLIYNIGCMLAQNCPAGGGHLLGRRAPTLPIICEECCAGNLCNKDTCKPHVTAVDTSPSTCVDKLPNCHDLATTTPLCQDKDNARLVGCLKSCSLCDKTPPVNPDEDKWSDWTQWTHCDVTCGRGNKVRVRTCTGEQGSCHGNDTEQHICDLKACPNEGCIDHLLECTQPDFIGSVCSTSMATSYCKKSCDLCVVDGGWSDWSQWGGCSATCGHAQQARIRYCNNPAPKNGGAKCQGQLSQSRNCSLAACPIDGHWSVWTPWENCSASCGVGSSVRVRTCTNPAPANGGRHCANQTSYIETKSCIIKPCAVDGHWSDWSPWMPCDVTCGAGTIQRVRNCDNPAPSVAGKPCPNPSSFIQTQPCNPRACPTVPTPTSTHKTVTSPVGSQPIHISTGSLITCSDSPACTDSIVADLACNDAYIATTYCPRLCHVCGPTQSTSVCADKAGAQCQDPLYHTIACADPDLSHFCEKTCQICH